MNNYSKLIKANLISFNTALLTNYKKLGLDEIDAIILHLYHQSVIAMTSFNPRCV